jgi:hypothetical protein
MGIVQKGEVQRELQRLGTGLRPGALVWNRRGSASGLLQKVLQTLSSDGQTECPTQVRFFGEAPYLGLHLFGGLAKPRF